MTTTRYQSHRGRQRQGFTILELMLGVLIISIVFATVYSIWSTAIRAWKRGSAAADVTQRQHVVLDALVDMTRSMVLLPSDEGLYRVVGTDQESADSISFVTSSDMLLPASEAVAGGMRRVTISLQTDQYGRAFLALQNQPALMDVEAGQEAPLHVFSADVIGFDVRYRNPRDGTWGDKWEEGLLVPSAIEYTVAFDGGTVQSEPLIVTRAIELPAADLVMDELGERVRQQNTTNTVTRREMSVPDAGGGSE